MSEITLDKLNDNREAVVVDINGGRTLFSKLSSMGIHPGEKLKKISSFNNGPVIVEVKSTKVAIGRGMASRIIVKEVER